MVARIDSTLREFRADRDRLLQNLAAVARPARSEAAQTFAGSAARTPAPAPVAAQTFMGDDMTHAPWVAPPAPAAPAAHSVPPPNPMLAPAPPMPPPAPDFSAPSKPPRRLSPQQMLLGTGAVLLVSAAIAFAAVAWESLSLAVQAGTLLMLTGVVCAASVTAAGVVCVRPGRPWQWPDSP